MVHSISLFFPQTRTQTFRTPFVSRGISEDRSFRGYRTLPWRRRSLCSRLATDGSCCMPLFSPFPDSKHFVIWLPCSWGPARTIIPATVAEECLLYHHSLHRMVPHRMVHGSNSVYWRLKQLPATWKTFIQITPSFVGRNLVGAVNTFFWSHRTTIGPLIPLFWNSDGLIEFWH